MKWITKTRKYTNDSYLLLTSSTGKVLARVEESSDDDETYYAEMFDDATGKFVSIGLFTYRHLATKACEDRYNNNQAEVAEQ